MYFSRAPVKNDGSLHTTKEKSPDQMSRRFAINCMFKPFKMFEISVGLHKVHQSEFHS